MLSVLTVIGALVFSPVIASAQQPCSTNAQQVVNEIYREVLNRPTSADAATFVRQLRDGAANVRDIVRSVAMSRDLQLEFSRSGRNPVRYDSIIDTLYRRLMNREIGDRERQSYLRTAGDRGLAAVVDDMLSSPEYDRTYGAWEVPGRSGLRYCSDTLQASRGNGQSVRRMDRNNDGVVTRREWRGSESSFDARDWNRDGLLSGDELRDDDVRSRNARNREFDRNYRFDALDVDRDGRIEWREWRDTEDIFASLDSNNDNALSRAEVAGSRDVVGTSGDLVTVNAAERWTDTGIQVRAGDSIYFDASGNVQLSPDPKDSATADGSWTNRRAPEAPLRDRLAGALIARIGNSAPIFIGARGSVAAAPNSGRLYLSVNDDYLGDNAGAFRVSIETRGR
jgi:hypothetical protein